MRITFLGGAGTVTGSKFLVEAAGRRVLVDCGLFQGLKELRLRNRAPLAVAPGTIDAVVLTHAHLDHSGHLPLLVRDGFRGAIHATAATIDLCAILLPDSGFLQEKEAEYANRHGFSKHRPALPLYTEAEARACLDAFEPHPFGTSFAPAPGISARFLRAGHILGAAMVELTAGGKTLLFTGDLGRPGSATMHDPARVAAADWLVVESTYGDRTHPAEDAEAALAAVVTRTAARGGSVLIPAFAVGRVQALLHHVARLKRAGRIPDLPVFLDSPMAVEASRVFAAHPRDHRLTPAECAAMEGAARYVADVDESKRIAALLVPRIILSASGMATGGRVLHHLKIMAPDPRNTILFAGFQAAGTRGASMLAGARTVKIHGAQVPVAAEIRNLDMLSAHADAGEILGWLDGFAGPPREVFVVHGEAAAAAALGAAIGARPGWTARVPALGETVDLGA